jgi:hypothetical protein
MMRWYVKHEGTGSILGPLTKDEALGMADTDCMVFSDDIFSPSFVLTSEAKELVIEMRDELQITPGTITRQNTNTKFRALLQRSIDTITLLSREKLVTGSIEGGVLSLGDVPDGVAVDIRDFDVEGVEALVEEDENGDEYFQVGTV